MLKIDDFKDYGIYEETLKWERFEENGLDKEIDLIFCAEPFKDNVWYEVIVGVCLDDEFKVEQLSIRLYSLKKAIEWWNNYFKKEEK